MQKLFSLSGSFQMFLYLLTYQWYEITELVLLSCRPGIALGSVCARRFKDQHIRTGYLTGEVLTKWDHLPHYFNSMLLAHERDDQWQ
jgi:hypothetical protein